MPPACRWPSNWPHIGCTVSSIQQHSTQFIGARQKKETDHDEICSCKPR